MTVVVNFRTGTSIRWIFSNAIIGTYKARDMARLEEVDSVTANGELIKI